jgi:hypothetical protein
MLVHKKPLCDPSSIWYRAAFYSWCVGVMNKSRLFNADNLTNSTSFDDPVHGWGYVGLAAICILFLAFAKKAAGPFPWPDCFRKKGYWLSPQPSRQLLPPGQWQ